MTLDGNWLSRSLENKTDDVQAKRLPPSIPSLKIGASGGEPLDS